MNVKFIQLTAAKFAAWKASYEGIFVQLLADATIGETVYKAGLYFGGHNGWEFLTNVDQDKTSEIHSASINETSGLVSFFNSTDGTGTALLTLDISTYVGNTITTAIQALDTTTDVTIATESNGVVTIKAGVKEEDGIIKQGTGTDITLAKVATTGKAEDITLNQYKKAADLGEGEDPKIAEGTTLQEAIEDIIDSIEGDAEAKKVQLYKKVGSTYSVATSMAADGADYELWQGATLKDGALTGGIKIFASNIEKDSFVNNGEVVYGSMSGDTFTASATGDAYLHLVIGTADSDEKDVYIAAKDMIKQLSIADDSTNYLTFDGSKLGVKLGEFDLDADGTLKDTADANGLKKDGLVKASEVGAIILANEKVTATALTNLDERLSEIESAVDGLDESYTTVTGDTTTPASGVKVTVTDSSSSSDNDHSYTVGAEMVWLTDLPE